MLVCGHTGGKPGHKTRCRRFMANGSENLVQNPMLKPALQAKVSLAMTKGSANGH